MLELFSYSVSFTQLALLFFAAMFIGMSKTGVPGAGMVSIPLVVIIFGSKASTGILLPILIFADVIAAKHYYQHVNWQHLKRLLPLTVIGVIIACVVGNYINDAVFRNIMAVIIFAALGLMIWQENSTQLTVPTSPWFIVAIGICGGFASMIGNMAGPILALYLLAMRFPKNQFIGTGAWFFLCINIIKLPFHIFVWQTITVNSVLFDLMLIPAIALGAYIGVRVISKVSEVVFRRVVVVITAVAAIAMFS